MPTWRDIGDEAREPRLGLVDAHGLRRRRGRDVDPPARSTKLVETLGGLLLVDLDQRVDGLRIPSPLLQLVEEAPVALGCARRIAEHFVRTGEVVTDAIPARRPEVAIER